MIRFPCPTCQRTYELADAMFGLPLVCKGCGAHLKVPPPGTDEVPALPASAPVADAPGPGSLSSSVADASGLSSVAPAPAPVAHAPGSPIPGSRDVILSPEAWAKLEAPPPPVLPEPKPWGAVAAAAPDAPVPPRERKALGLVVDVAVVLVLLVVGAFVGEFVVRKSTAQVLEGLAAPKFPPTDLLLWAAAPVLLLLVYALLGSRGKTLGALLRKRAG